MEKTMKKKLLSPLAVGDVTLKNRVVMAPLTRSRAGQPGDVPTPLNALYYAQRASAGLIVTEATQISRQGQGYAFTPGIYTDEQEAGWKKVVEAVHKKGGRISAQLWHVGRMSHSSHQGGLPPVAPSALIAEKSKCFIAGEGGRGRFVPVEKPRALLTEEIPGLIDQYRQAAIRAMRAGFDFVEEHAANGYLLQQFLSTNTNLRTDRYGGSLENRARLVLEIFDALAEVTGDCRTGVRLSPGFGINGIDDAEWEAMTFYLACELNRRRPVYLHIAEPGWVGGIPFSEEFKRQVRKAFGGTIILCGGYTPESAEEALEKGWCDAVAFGRSYIANPDLVERIRDNAALNEPDRSTFYGGGEKGYTDYPAMIAGKR